MRRTSIQKHSHFPKIRIAALSKIKIKKVRNRVSNAETKSSSPPHKCDHCGKTFSTKGAAALHSRTHRRQRTSSFKCVQCSRTFKDQCHLLQHVQVHMPTCSDCGTKFVHQHEEENGTPRVCESCRAKPADEKHTCDHCRRTFKTKLTLASHRSRVHKSKSSRKKRSKTHPSKYVRQLVDDDQLHSSAAGTCPGTPPSSATEVDVGSKGVKTNFLNGLLNDYCGKAAAAAAATTTTATIESQNTLRKEYCDTDYELKNRINSRIIHFMNKYSINNIPKKPIKSGQNGSTRGLALPNGKEMASVSTATAMDNKERMNVQFKENLNIQFKLLINHGKSKVETQHDEMQLKSRIRDKLKKLLGIRLVQN